MRESHVEEARKMVKADLRMSDGRKLEEVVGCLSEQWARRRTAEQCKFNPLATFLDVNGNRGLQMCQNKNCKTGKMRKGSEGSPEEYDGAMYCEECMPAKYDDTSECVELTWYRVEVKGGRT